MQHAANAVSLGTQPFEDGFDLCVIVSFDLGADGEDKELFEEVSGDLIEIFVEKNLLVFGNPGKRAARWGDAAWVDLPVVLVAVAQGSNGIKRFKRETGRIDILMAGRTRRLDSIDDLKIPFLNTPY